MTGRKKSPQARGAFTLVELLVVISIIALLISILLPSLTRVRWQANATKCLANQHSMAIAITAYTSEYSGTLPGPIHPAIKRKLFSFTTPQADADRQKSLTWLLRPYFGTGGSKEQENTLADEVATCPTAEKIVPDQVFFDAGGGSCWDERPYSYVANTWGVIGTPGQPASNVEWPQTDPPHYFGAWFFCDPSPVRSDVSWKPKNIENIRFPGSEWSVADAWYRKIAQGQGRSGTPPKRLWNGTFAPQASNYLAVIPDRPYHGISPNVVKSHSRMGRADLPAIEFKGSTNMAYFDGHAAPFKGSWKDTGEGGTVNPWWQKFGGRHAANEIWYPPS